MLFQGWFVEACFSQSLGGNSDELVRTHNMNIKYIVDKHSPEKEKIIILSPHEQWYNDHIWKMRADPLWEKNKLQIDKQIYTNKSKALYKLLDSSKRASKIKQHKTDSDSKELFPIV